MSEAEDRVTMEEQNDPGLLHVEETSHYRLAFRLQDSKMSCLAEFELLPQESENQETPPVLPTPPNLIWTLLQNNLYSTIDYEGLYDFCADIDLGHSQVSTVIARGKEPTKGEDGWFELMVKVSGDEHEFKEDESGHVDLKNLNAYSEIEPEQKLGMVHSPKKGIPGMTVLGEPIQAEPGDAYVLLGGEGVELRYDDRVAFATKEGRALFEKNTISVVDQLIIPGDLDLHVGNIDFKGFVEIKGEVPDDFCIRSTKGIKIGGLVGASRIESDGSIEITSMAGKEIGHIVCHGDLRAGFLNQVHVEAFGDVFVGNEIRNSVVKATGQIVVEKGAIIGGHCLAMEGIEVKTAGTSSGQKTRLTAGVYFPDSDRFEYLRNELKNVNRQIDALNDGLTPLKKYIERHPSCGDTSHKRLDILNEKMAHLLEEKEHFSAEITASTPQQFSNQNPKINVQYKLMEGVLIVLGNSIEEIKHLRSGPISIIENSENGGLRYLDISHLQVKAQALEEALISSEDDAEIPSET